MVGISRDSLPLARGEASGRVAGIQAARRTTRRWVMVGTVAGFAAAGTRRSLGPRHRNPVVPPNESKMSDGRDFAGLAAAGPRRSLGARGRNPGGPPNDPKVGDGRDGRGIRCRWHEAKPRASSPESSRAAERTEG